MLQYTALYVSQQISNKFKGNLFNFSFHTFVFSVSETRCQRIQDYPNGPERNKTKLGEQHYMVKKYQIKYNYHNRASLVFFSQGKYAIAERTEKL